MCLLVPAMAAEADSAEPTYIGSSACKTCHRSLYERWKKTRMANVVRDPAQDSDAILPDLSKANPLVTFTKQDIAFVYGSKWKQRYFTKVGDDYFPLPAQWDVAHSKWLPYFVKSGTDWWSGLYPADNMKRPTGPLCDGCHSVNYNLRTKTVTEWNVGCERCHGPGSVHVKSPARDTIVNPRRLDPVRASDTCIQCHSQGRPPRDPIEGQHVDWPVGFNMRNHLSDLWQLEEHHLGETSFTHFADGTAHKNRMQGNDFVQSAMYTHGVTCFSCHDPHGTSYDADLLRPPSEMCLQCHGPGSPNGPHAASITEHTHHKAGSEGNECVACHMPRIEQTTPDDFVRSHTFRFITPAMTEPSKIPNPCTSCHTEKTITWATQTLEGWSERSPWRMRE